MAMFLVRGETPRRRTDSGVPKRAVRAVLASFSLALLAAPIASAAPITRTITGGLSQILVYRGQPVIGSIPLGSTFTTSVSGTLVIDEAAQSVNSLDITLGPDIPLALSSPYGGFDNIVINTANVQDGAGYTSSLELTSASAFEVSAGPLDVAAVWSGSDSTLVNPPASNMPISFSAPQINMVIGDTAELTGLTLFFVPGAMVGETEDLLVVANLDLGLTPIPEPSSALLLGLALAGLAATRGRRSNAVPAPQASP